MVKNDKQTSISRNTITKGDIKKCNSITKGGKRKMSTRKTGKGVFCTKRKCEVRWVYNHYYSIQHTTMWGQVPSTPGERENLGQSEPVKIYEGGKLVAIITWRNPWEDPDTDNIVRNDVQIATASDNNPLWVVLSTNPRDNTSQQQ